MIEICMKSGSIEISAQAVCMGMGWSVTLTGGDTPHLGAVALGVPRPSLRDGNEISSSVSVLTITGHKEDEIVRKIAARLSASLNLPVVVSAGVHVDNITEDELKYVSKLINDVTEELAVKLRTGK